MDTLHIDGSLGEGGGQILRTSLGLAALTGQSIVIKNIRAGRKKPGLRHQHLTAARAAARICNGRLRGDDLGAKQLEFYPQQVVPGKYRFDIGTAGSAALVLQTVLPALLATPEKSKLTIEGGTHNPMAPSVDFLNTTFLPLLERMGARVELKLVQYGFYPAGGGKIEVVIHPCEKLKPLELLHRGELKEERGKVLIAKIPEHVAKQEKNQLCQAMGWHLGWTRMYPLENTRGPGNVVMACLEYENVHEVFTAFGAKGVRVHQVINGLVKEAKAYRDATAPVGPHLADQLLIPLALAGGGKFRATELTQHTLTNMDMVSLFLPVIFETKDHGANGFEVTARQDVR